LRVLQKSTIGWLRLALAEALIKLLLCGRFLHAAFI